NSFAASHSRTRIPQRTVELPDVNSLSPQLLPIAAVEVSGAGAEIDVITIAIWVLGRGDQVPNEIEIQSAVVFEESWAGIIGGPIQHATQIYRRFPAEIVTLVPTMGGPQFENATTGNAVAQALTVEVHAMSV